MTSKMCVNRHTGWHHLVLPKRKRYALYVHIPRIASLPVVPINNASLLIKHMTIIIMRKCQLLALPLCIACTCLTHTHTHTHARTHPPTYTHTRTPTPTPTPTRTHARTHTHTHTHTFKNNRTISDCSSAGSMLPRNSVMKL